MKNRSLILCFILITVLILSVNGAVFAGNSEDNTLIIAETTDGSVETPPPVDEPEPPSIIIQEYPATMRVGESDKLSYVLNYSDTDKVTWKTSNSDVLSIDADGTITAAAPGEATITVKAGTAKDSVRIIVKEIKATSIKIISDDFGLTDNVTGYKLKKGDVIKLSIEAEPKDSALGDVSWEVDDEKIAEIDAGGTLVALENGKVKVTVTDEQSGLTDQIEIQIGSNIPWALIAVVGAIILIIIILIILIVRKKMRRGSRSSKRPSKYDKYDDVDDYDDEDYDDDDYDKKKREALEKERIRQEAYRQGFEDRNREMTKVFDPKDFEFKDDDIK